MDWGVRLLSLDKNIEHRFEICNLGMCSASHGLAYEDPLIVCIRIFRISGFSEFRVGMNRRFRRVCKIIRGYQNLQAPKVRSKTLCDFAPLRETKNCKRRRCVAKPFPHCLHQNFQNFRIFRISGRDKHKFTSLQHHSWQKKHSLESGS